MYSTQSHFYGMGLEDLSTSRTSQDPSLSTVVCLRWLSSWEAHMFLRGSIQTAQTYTLPLGEVLGPTHISSVSCIGDGRLLFLVTGLYLDHETDCHSCNHMKYHFYAQETYCCWSNSIYSQKLISESYIKVDLSVIYQEPALS